MKSPGILPVEFSGRDGLEGLFAAFDRALELSELQICLKATGRFYSGSICQVSYSDYELDNTNCKFAKLSIVYSYVFKINQNAKAAADSDANCFELIGLLSILASS